MWLNHLFFTTKVIVLRLFEAICLKIERADKYHSINLGSRKWWQEKIMVPSPLLCICTLSQDNIKLGPFAHVQRFFTLSQDNIKLNCTIKIVKIPHCSITILVIDCVKISHCSITILDTFIGNVGW
jgi:hypothetical protein